MSQPLHHPVQQSVKQSFMNWSGGKDSALCLHRIKQDPTYHINALLTSVNAVHDRVSMHGVRRSLLEAQAASLSYPLHTLELPEMPGMTEYESIMTNQLNAFKKLGYTHSVFGDIFLEDLRAYREIKLEAMGLQAAFPLWNIPTDQLMEEFLDLGFKAIIVCVNDRYLDKSFCGRLIDGSFVRDLPPGVDVCGENGEYHSFVFDGPVFNHPVTFTKGEIVRRTYDAPRTNTLNPDSMDQPSSYGFYFCDLLPSV
ncbi:adenine nucleotide alpha hydrolase [Pseudoflavitalea rhizosphaerae]|uniref:adenine nucleotide alpha hydrolase n=1 Tax=Pseudoflavitalea rhizosphaerae TaxID=1884793 RepID=UPI001F496C72|nr:adenine nucleotide alpha hydrolase [Pseudoflavitalea rhizosphaerae]